MLKPSLEKTNCELIFLFETLPTFNESDLVWAIRAIDPTSSEARITVEAGAEDSVCIALESDDYPFRLMGINHPIGVDTLAESLQFFDWDDATQHHLTYHHAHLICLYEGRSLTPAQQLMALYNLAISFRAKGLLGILDRAAQRYIPVGDLQRTLSETQMPLELWTGLVQIPTDSDEVLFCSTGHERFGINDFMYRCQRGNAERVRRMFLKLLHYACRSGASLEVGDTAEVEKGQFLKFSVPQVSTLNSTLSSTLNSTWKAPKTIFLETIEASQINPFPVMVCDRPNFGCIDCN
jgi:hypothetical protein